VVIDTPSSTAMRFIVVVCMDSRDDDFTAKVP
jgi:hypothetical protein